jgi:hypothetical protein
MTAKKNSKKAKPRADVGRAFPKVLLELVNKLRAYHDGLALGDYTLGGFGQVPGGGAFYFLDHKDGGRVEIRFR